MASGKLNRAFSRWICFSLVCFLPLVESLGRSLSLQFNNCNQDSSICIQCWNADAVNGTAPKEASNLVETNCLASDMTFEISKGTDKIYNWGRTPQGWAVNDRDDFKITVKASVDWIDSSHFSRVAFEVQLCNIDNFMLCQPVIAPTSFFNDTTLIDNVQNLQTTQTPSVTRFVDLDMVIDDIVEETLNFGEITEPGTYRILTSLLLSDGSNVSGVSMISDVKYLNAINEDPLELSSNSRTAIIVISSVTSTVILFLLFQTVSNRKAQVFELTQGKFIIAMQVCALVATSSLVMFTPTDPYCQFSSPFLYLSTHMVYAILLGRMWRVRAVISPLLLLTLERKDDWTTKIVHWIGRFTACARSQESQQKKIRLQITDYQLARVIILLILPQLFVQLLILTVYDNKSILDYTERNGIIEGIYICEYGPFYSPLHVISVALIAIEFFWLGLLMWGSRDLPSLFNETKKVWQILRGTFVFVLSGTLLIAATVDHENSAQIRVLVPAFILGLNMCQTCWVITWSKLRVAWRGQTILVTKLIADHNFNKGIGKYPSQNSAHTFSGYQPSSFQLSQHSSQISASQISERQQSAQSTAAVVEGGPISVSPRERLEQIAADDRSTDSSVFLAESEEPVAFDDTDSHRNAEHAAASGSDDSVSLVDPSSTSFAATGDTSQRKRFRQKRRYSNTSHMSRSTMASAATRGSIFVRRKFVGRGQRSSITMAKSVPPTPTNRKSLFGSVFAGVKAPRTVKVESIDMNPSLSHDKIRISETEAPGRRLLLRMIDVQRMLAKINTSLLTGSMLNKDDWQELRDGCVTLGEVFESEVVFEWEDEDESSIDAASHLTPPRRPQGYRGNRPQAASLPPNRPQAVSLPPKSLVTSMTHAGPKPKRRSVTFQSPEMKEVSEEDDFVGSMLRQPLQPIMSIGNPSVYGETSEPSEVDGVHEQNGVGGQQSQSDSGDSLPKHRVRPNPHVSHPADSPVVEVPVGELEKEPTDPFGVSEISEGIPEGIRTLDDTLDGVADVSPGQISLGKFQKAKKLKRVSGVSHDSSGGDSDSEHEESHHRA